MEVECKTDPKAPHGFLRDASHCEGRYVCECEQWQPEETHLVHIEQLPIPFAQIEADNCKNSVG